MKANDISVKTDSTEASEVREQMLDHGFDLIWKAAQVRAELPKLLADLVDAGCGDVVIDYVHDWGRGSKPITEIHRECLKALGRRVDDVKKAG